MRPVIPITLFLFLIAPSRAQQKALNANSASSERALTSSTLRRAHAGSPQDQFAVAKAYANGAGVAQDFSQALYWFGLAANRGSAPAMNELGRMLADGIGVDRDDLRAFQWFLRAASERYAPAQQNVGVMYLQGRGVRTDID